MPLYESHKIDASEDLGVNDSAEASIGDLIAGRLSRRDALLGGAGAVGLGAAAAGDAVAQASGPSTLAFREIAHTYNQTHHVAPGYEAQVLIRWGDKLVAGAPAFDPSQQSAAAQEKQFGYNCDFIGFSPLPQGSNSSDRGLLFVNNEDTNANLMFAGLGAAATPSRWRFPARSPATTSSRPRPIRPAGTSSACSTTAPAGRRRGERSSRRRRTSTAISAAIRRSCPTPRCTSATASPGTAGTRGPSTSITSTSRRSRTSRTGSAGSSRSTRTIRPRCRRSAPRSAASSMRAAATPSPRTDGW